MWYAARLLFRSADDHGGREMQWEESIRLISADSEEEAQEMARYLGRSERARYSSGGEKITWLFDRVERVYQIAGDSLADGTEVFSRFLREAEVTSLLKPFEDAL